MSFEKVGKVGGDPVVEDAGRRYRALEVEADPVALQLPPVLERPAPVFRPYPPELQQEGGPLRRLSPRRSWPEVQALDRKMDALDERRVRLAEKLATLEQQLREAEVADRQAIAAWQLDDERGARPVPTVPAIQAELEQVRSEIDSTAIAEDTILKEKVAFVAKHRERLAADAAKEPGAGRPRIPPGDCRGRSRP